MDLRYAIGIYKNRTTKGSVRSGVKIHDTTDEFNDFRNLIRRILFAQLFAQEFAQELEGHYTYYTGGHQFC